MPIDPKLLDYCNTDRQRAILARMIELDGWPELGITKEAAKVIGGAATATGGYLYFTAARGWKMALGAVTSFGGGVMFYNAGAVAVGLVFADPMPDLAAGVAGTMTLGTIYALRKAAEKLELATLFGKDKP